MKCFRMALCAVLLFTLAFPASFSAPAIAATTGLVRGTVTLDGKPAANASLTLTGEGTTLRTTSGTNGGYVFSEVPFGHYHLVAHANGAQDGTADLDVSSDSVATIDLALSALKTIAVTSASTHVGASGTPVSANALGRQQLAALPTNNSLSRVVETMPGIVRFSYNEPVAHGFHGLTYELDGAPFPQATSSNFAEIIDPKDVDSVEVLTGAFPAEYGGSREGAVVNILTNRANSLNQPYQGTVTGGLGNYGQATGSLDQAFKIGSAEAFLSANTQHTNRGLDTPTFIPINDNGSQSDEFLRFVTPIGSQQTLAFDFSNQLAQFEIPINTDPNNPNDPQVSVPGTNDTQREYDRYANFNYTMTSRDGHGIFQIIPWYRSTRIAYDGDLAKDVLATAPDPNTGLPVNLIGLRQDRSATYVGVRISQFHSSEHHAWKVGLDADRENFTAYQEFACFDSNCDGTGTTGAPFYPFFSNATQPGTQIGLYAQDKWSPSREISIDYGVRYDHSTGFTSGNQISPRIGVNIQADSKNVLHVYYGRFYAAPQLEDVRQACVALQGCPATPVYDLQPERDAYWEMGVAHTFNPYVKGYVNLFERTAVNILDTTQFLNTPLFAVFNNAIGRDTGIEFRLQGRSIDNTNSWFASTTVSHSEAGGISGSTFLFGPNPNPPGPFTAAILQPEDHDQAVSGNAAFTHRFGRPAAGNDTGNPGVSSDPHPWFATLQSEYGTGYPVQFENGPGRLPTHLTFDLALGKDAESGLHKTIGFDLTIDNLLDHQYIIKIANGFNTTQIASGRNILFRLTAPL